MKPTQLFFLFGCALVLGTSSPTPFAWAGAPQSLPDLTLAQSVPAETTLAQPDLPDAKDVWVKMIASARSTVDTGQFYVFNEPGQALEPVIQELEKAGARGVKIRVIVDQAMIKNDPASLDRLRKIRGLELRILNLKNITGGIIHAKYFVIDREAVFVGSHNFDWRALSQIHETGVYLRDANVAAQLTEIFEIDWKICQTGAAPSPIAPAPVKKSAVELVASPPQFNPASVRWSLTALKEMLSGAKRSIRFQLLDYSTSAKGGRWGEIDDALRAAAVRGVRVEILVSDWSTGQPAIGQLKQLQQIPGITVKIATIPPFSGGCIPFSRTIHTKMLVVDDESLWVGTSNWSKDYFEATRGVELIFRNADLARQGNRIIETLWQSPYARILEPTKTYTPPVRDCSAQ